MKINNRLVSIEDLIGNKIDSKYTAIDQLLDDADINFNVDKESLAETFGDKRYAGYFGVKRMDTNEVFAIVRKNYQPIQTIDILKPFHEIVTEFGAAYTNAGVISNGSKIWIQAQLPNSVEIRNNDVIKPYIMMLVSHDGKRTNAMFPYTSRIACNNQFYQMTKSISTSDRISHQRSWENQLEICHRGFVTAIKSTADFAEQARELDSKSMSKSELEKFVGKIFKDSKVKINNKEATVSADTARETVISLFSVGEGNTGKTRWDAFNAVTEYLDHHKGSKRVNKAVNNPLRNIAKLNKTYERKFMNGLQGGLDNNLKQQAFKLLLNS